MPMNGQRHRAPAVHRPSFVTSLAGTLSLQFSVRLEVEDVVRFVAAHGPFRSGPVDDGGTCACSAARAKLTIRPTSAL
jgi:hypothetical protein